MCTVSLFRRANGFRVHMNRDERHDRTEELPPQRLPETLNSYGPVDPSSQGTWIAHNNNGYWGCLLNGYFEEPNKNIDQVCSKPLSRGTILPRILESSDPFQSAKDLDYSMYTSFRLIIGNHETVHVYEWDYDKYSNIDFHASIDNCAFLLTSSSWQQNHVTQLRAKLFKESVNIKELLNNKNGQIPEFNVSKYPNAESAPMMHRSYSGTKSITTLDISKNNITMYYEKTVAYSLKEQAEVAV